MQAYLTRRLLMGCGVVALVMIAYSSAVMWSTDQVLSTTNSITQSDQVLNELDAFPFQLAQAAEAYRDFILTGEEQTLASYQKATATVQQRLAKLQTLVSDSPEQEQRIESLQALVQESLQHIQQIVQIRRDRGGEAAMTAIAADSGSDAVEQMRAIVQDIEGAEWRSLTTRTAMTHAFVQRMHRMALDGTVIILLGLIGVAFLIRHWLSNLNDTGETVHPLL